MYLEQGDGNRRVSLERQCARQEIEECNAQGVDIRATI